MKGSGKRSEASAGEPTSDWWNEGGGNGITHSLDSEEDLRPLNDHDPRVLPTTPRVLILPRIIYRCLMIAGALGRAPTLINEPDLRGAGFPGDAAVMSSSTVPPLMWNVCVNWRGSLAVWILVLLFVFSALGTDAEDFPSIYRRPLWFRNERSRLRLIISLKGPQRKLKN